MTAETTILEIAHGALGSSYLDAIKVMYQHAVEDGVFETVESEYEAGVRELSAVFSSEQTDRLLLRTFATAVNHKMVYRSCLMPQSLSKEESCPAF